MSTNNLSVIILTHRNDQRFRDSVTSALFADEVVVVTFGAVKVELTPSQQVRIVKGGEAIEDFAQARNKALALVKSEWVLFLDSDEVITPESVPVLEHCLQNSMVAGYYVQRRDVFYGRTLRHGETGQHWLLRLARKKLLRFERPVHEIGRVEGRTVRSQIVLEHRSHVTISEFWRDISRYAYLEALYRHQQHMRFSVWQMLVYPPAKFMQNYFLKHGFLDGWQGLVYASLMSCHSLMVRVFLYENA